MEAAKARLPSGGLRLEAALLQDAFYKTSLTRHLSYPDLRCRHAACIGVVPTRLAAMDGVRNEWQQCIGCVHTDLVRVF